MRKSFPELSGISVDLLGGHHLSMNLCVSVSLCVCLSVCVSVCLSRILCVNSLVFQDISRAVCNIHIFASKLMRYFFPELSGIYVDI